MINLCNLFQAKIIVCFRKVRELSHRLNELETESRRIGSTSVNNEATLQTAFERLITLEKELEKLHFDGSGLEGELMPCISVLSYSKDLFYPEKTSSFAMEETMKLENLTRHWIAELEQSSEETMRSNQVS